MSTEVQKNNIDAELIRKIHNGDDTAFDELLSKYSPLIKSLASKYNLYSSDNDDYIQEGLIAFLSAVKSFSSDKNNSFSAYAALCIKNKLIDVNKRFSSEKQKPLNDYTPLKDEELSELYDINALNPESIVIERESFNSIMQALNSVFSDFESDVFYERFNGSSYSEIADKHSVSLKSIDNAMQRIRKKITKVCSN